MAEADFKLYRPEEESNTRVEGVVPPKMSPTLMSVLRRLFLAELMISRSWVSELT